MFDIDQIKANYCRLSNEALLSEAERAMNFIPEVQELLIDELNNRELPDAAKKIRKEQSIARMLKSADGLREFYELRDQEGWAHSEIINELELRGISVFDIAQIMGNEDELHYQQFTRDSYAGNFADSETMAHRARAHRSGKVYVSLGILVLLAGLFIPFKTLGIESQFVGLLICLITGLALVVKGRKLLSMTK